MATKTKTVYISIGANAQSNTNVPTNDDNKQRKLTGIYVGSQQVGLEVQAQIAGTPYVDIDASIIRAFSDFVEADATAQAGVQFSIWLNNTTGAAINNIPYTLRYEV